MDGSWGKLEMAAKKELFSTQEGRRFVVSKGLDTRVQVNSQRQPGFKERELNWKP
jgi:hypothetical protein